MLAKLPSAIVYNWSRVGTQFLISDVYFQESLFDKVQVYFQTDTSKIKEDFAKYKPDVIVSFGDLQVDSDEINRRLLIYSEKVPDNILANDIVCQSTFINCQNQTPKFSIFTPAYKTGDRIYRAYESLKNQTYGDWEWVIVDDSPVNDNQTWILIQEISNSDYRVKPHKIYPQTSGNVGLAKFRAAMLCQGDWLLELDHDDELLPDCLEECLKASEKYPDAGFIYSDFTTPYEDGTFKSFDTNFSGNWYARPDNLFCFGYAGHIWEERFGRTYLRTFYPEINPRTIRFNITMPNHVRVWRRDVYLKIGGHNSHFPVADDFELIIRTFLETKMIHIRKLLYIQYHNNNSTVDNNAININRLSRLIRDHYDLQIHNRILELGGEDWDWIQEESRSYQFLTQIPEAKFYDEEKYLNYIYE